MDESVVEVMLKAIDGDPKNVALRIHMGQLFEEAGRHQEAWEHATAGLATEPANVELLSIAVRAGRRSGHSTEADGYETLHKALGGGDVPTSAAPDESEEQQSEEQHRVPIAPSGDVPDSADELFDIWGESDPMPEPDVGELSRERLLLRDVGGMEDVKERLQASFLNPMRNPEIQQAYGKKMRGGLLLWGPPGCGKTFIAKAVAGELDANFYAVGLSDVLDMWIGSSEQNISKIFEIARQNSPCVLFLDEVDALGQKRTQLRGAGGAMRNVVNQLLQEMDGVASDNDGVFILAATNHPWDIDSALMRPGRLDRSLIVLPPDRDAREAIFGLHMNGRPTHKLKLDWCAKHSAKLTGADISLVCEQATELAMTESLSSGVVVPITMSHMQKALKTVRPSYGPWTELARNYATFNNESGIYDDLISWLNENRF